jgi:chorismate mutase/prephenate dehydratase
VFGSKARLLPCATISEVFAAVAAQKTTYGVVPIENSTAGRVAETVDQLTSKVVNVCDETYLKV